jgi:hypothetical protein
MGEILYLILTNTREKSVSGQHLTVKPMGNLDPDPHLKVIAAALRYTLQVREDPYHFLIGFSSISPFSFITILLSDGQHAGSCHQPHLHHGIVPSQLIRL